jgi:tetratricopeptide (TPR) repeat protein
MEEATSIRKVVYGEESSEVADSLKQLATELYYGDQFAAAADVIREALRIRSDVLKEDPASVLTLRNAIIAMQLKQELYAEAEQPALECYEDAVRLGETNWSNKMAEKLATIYENLGNEAEAARWKDRVKD